MERKGNEGPTTQGGDKGLDHEPDDGAEAERSSFVVPFGFKHFGEVSSHALGFGQVVPVTGHGEFDTAPERFNEITCKAGAVASKPVDNADGWIETGSQTLPLDGVVKKPVSVIERDIQRMHGLAFFPLKQILCEGGNIARPKITGIECLQTKYSVD